MSSWILCSVVCSVWVMGVLIGGMGMAGLIVLFSTMKLMANFEFIIIF